MADFRPFERRGDHVSGVPLHDHNARAAPAVSDLPLLRGHLLPGALRDQGQLLHGERRHLCAPRTWGTVIQPKLSVARLNQMIQTQYVGPLLSRPFFLRYNGSVHSACHSHLQEQEQQQHPHQQQQQQQQEEARVSPLQTW